MAEARPVNQAAMDRHQREQAGQDAPGWGMSQAAANEAAVAPAKPLFLGGKTYAISPPTLSIMASIGSVARRHCEAMSPLAALLHDPAWKELSPELQRECAREATRAQIGGQRTVDQFDLTDQMLSNPEVLAFAIWCCALRNHPGLTLEEIRSGINPGNAAEVFINFDDASGMLALGGSAGASGLVASSTPEASSSKAAANPSAA